MSNHIRSLDRLIVSKPCDADWDSMIGNDQVRFCEHCKLHVNDLSSMTRQEAMRLVARSGGRLCVRYVQLPGGRALTKQVPEKLYRIGRRVSQLAAGAFTASLSLSTLSGQTRSDSSNKALRQTSAIAEETSVSEVGGTLSGVITDPNGAVVAGAIVTLTNSVNHVAFSYTTGDDGVYRFSFLTAGKYVLVAEAPSFERAEVSNVTIGEGLPGTRNLMLEIPQINAEVTVEAPVEVRTITMGVGGFVEPTEPLVKAAFKNDIDAVRDLIFTISTVDTVDQSAGMNAFAYAVEHSNSEMVQLLLASGANVNARNRNEQTALMYLRENATVDMVRTLIAAGAEINAHDESGNTPLMTAAASCNLVVVNELISDGAYTDAKDNDGQTVLMKAAANDISEITTLVLKSGVDVNAQDANGGTALINAARWGKPDTVKALIEAHAEIETKDDSGMTALMYAASNDDVAIARILIEASARVNAKTDEGETALMFAAEEGTPLTVKALIDAGAEVNARNQKGQTALIKAVDNGRVEAIKVLLNADADLTVRDNEGKTALSIAQANDNDEVTKLLKSRGAPE